MSYFGDAKEWKWVFRIAVSTILGVGFFLGLFIGFLVWA